MNYSVSLFYSLRGTDDAPAPSGEAVAVVRERHRAWLPGQALPEGLKISLVSPAQALTWFEERAVGSGSWRMKGMERKEIATPFLLPPKEKIKRRDCFVPCLDWRIPSWFLTKLCKQLFPSYTLSSSSDIDSYSCSASPAPVKPPVVLRAPVGLQIGEAVSLSVSKCSHRVCWAMALTLEEAHAQLCALRLIEQGVVQLRGLLPAACPLGPQGLRHTHVLHHTWNWNKPFSKLLFPFPRQQIHFLLTLLFKMSHSFCTLYAGL